MDYQPENQTQTTHTYYGEKRSQGMAIAAIVMGIISIATSCCIYAAIVTGALAIIFALLSRGGEMKMDTKGKTGLILGILGLVITIALYGFTFVYMIHSLGSLDKLMEYSNQITEQYMQYYQ
ncbi:MAG: hypothetical protein MR425_02275 [Lachnospiraceae bacterium]|nr:hypothetical protein [Lachnospiraceae bacterium]